MRRFLVPVILFAMTVGVFWKLLLTRQYTYLDSPDLANQVAPWLQAQAYAWQHGNFPLLWDPYVAGGQSLIGQAQPATAFPLNWLLFLAPLHKGFIQVGFLHWYMALVHFFAALATYALCRDLKRSQVASILSASAYAFGGYVATTWWPQQVQAVIFAPLALLFSFRAIRGERPWRSSFFAGFFLGLMWLQGHHQVPLFVVLGVSGIWAFHILRGKTWAIKFQHARMFVLVVAVMAMAAALQLFPAYSYGQDSVRWVGASHEVHWDESVPYHVHQTYSQPGIVLLGPFMNGFFHHANPFVGFTVVLLAIAAVALAWDDLAARLLAFLAIGGLLLSLGPLTPLHSILYAVVPVVEKARTPAVAIIVFHLGICPLAAFGLDRVLEMPRSNWVKLAGILSAAIGALLFLLMVHVQVDRAQIDYHLYTTPVTALAALLIAAMLFAMRNGSLEPRNTAVWFVVLVMLEIGNLNGMEMTNRDQGWEFWPQVERDRDIAQFLKFQPGNFRVEVKTEDVPYSFGDWYGIETFIGYTASLMTPFVKVLGEPAAHRLLGVRYYLAKAPASPDQHEVFTGSGGVKVFEVPNAMPRVWAVHEAERYTNPEVAPVLSKLDLPARTVLPGTLPDLQSCSGDRVSLKKHKAQTVSIDADMNCRGMVILADAYSKDWVATVDGASVPIYPAYSFLRGVVVGAGHHRIEYRYRPWSVYFGALLTFGSFGIALWLWRRREQP
ncbi:MAG: hypothetical protein LAO79_23280 [Acidobacteriia bacterium]|nr:hypothetical protein [Terriglobia bacterium]